MIAEDKLLMTALLDELIAAAERGYEYFIDVYDKKAMACIRATWRYKHYQRQRIEAAKRRKNAWRVQSYAKERKPCS